MHEVSILLNSFYIWIYTQKQMTEIIDLSQEIYSVMRYKVGTGSPVRAVAVFEEKVKSWELL